ncbi:MAG: hypothetical protein J3Q66DRAFT_99847 [Benniella sp.]|nr:MAG: hypothetical protein J3Q66DRAFT_99847 [Benniella sp.]
MLSDRRRDLEAEEDDDDDDDDDVAGALTKWELLQSTQGLMVPVICEADISWFNERYRRSTPDYQDMIARIIHKLRTTLWGVMASTSASESVVHYSSVHHKATTSTVKTPRTLNPSNPPKKAKEPAQNGVRAAFITQKLDGLNIMVDSHRKTFGLQGELKLKLVEPVSSAYSTIGVAMMMLYQRLLPSQDYLDKRAALLQRLERILNDAFPGSGILLQAFGSYASGLGSKGSDADLCITSATFQQSEPYNDMTKVAKVLKSAGMKRVEAILTARVPIVKFVDPQTTISCDINSNHVLGIYNSEMIRCYTLIDDRVKPFIYNLKALVKAHGINDSSKAYLSSYSYVLMAIGFLQAQDPPILPVLQAQPKEYMTTLYVQLDHNGKDGKGEIDCTFDRYPARHRHFGTANTKSIGQLLIEFFEFYSRYFDYKTMEVNIRLGGGIRMRDEVVDAIATGKSPKNGKGPIKLVVMDPFLKDRNVSGGCKAHKLTKVWEVFEALYLILSRGEFEAAFELMPGFQDESGWRHRKSPRRRTTAPATKVDGTAPRRGQKQTNMDNKDHQKARVALPQVVPASAPTHPVELAHVSASASLRTTSSMKAQTATIREAQSPASLRVQSTSTGEATMVSSAASVRAVSTMNQTSSGRRQQRRTAAVAATVAGSSTPSISSVPSTVMPLNPYVAHPSQQKLSSKKKKDQNQEHGRAAPKVSVTSQTNLANALSGVQQQPQQPQQQKQKQKLQENQQKQQKQQQQRQQTQLRQS